MPGAVASDGLPLLAQGAGFDLLGPDLARDVESAIQAALSGGALFAQGVDAPGIFRKVLGETIRDIDGHPRGKLFQEFLRKGPFEGGGEFPTDMVGKRLSDADTRKAVTFIYSHMVNCFKGAITELLAAKACADLTRRLRREGELPRGARLYVGDSVMIPRSGRKGALKGADLHILLEEPGRNAKVVVAGLGEVKSYLLPEEKLRQQLNQHVRRARGGLRVRGVDYPGKAVRVGDRTAQQVIRIVVVPDTWRLPRAFHFEGSALHVEPGTPLRVTDETVQVGRYEWRITLRWSQEALAEAAYGMTFWYMGKVGELIYSDGVPKEWQEMTPVEAGENAVKMMLYYAIQRCGTLREKQRAIALYNTYCFGYALGMSFRNEHRRREMLWPEDLEQILATGRTKTGCALD